jgi:alkylglycerol monooxygenase
MNDTINSLSMGIFSDLAQKILMKGLTIIPYFLIHKNYALIRWEDDTQISWTAWWLMFIFVDMGYYWMHRAHHECNVLWAGHNVHHSSNNYNLSTALRQSPLQSLFSWIFYLPLAFFFPPRLFAFHDKINTIYQFWIHTEAIPKLGTFIELIFNTPSHHRVHHGRSRGKNFGGTLIIFDRIFGTFQEEKVGKEFYGINHSLDTWNVFYIQFHHLIETFNVMKITPLLSHKLRVWFDLGPSYNWFMLDYEKREKKEEIKPYGEIWNQSAKNSGMVAYIFVHFIVCTILTVSFMFTPYSSKIDYFLFGLLALSQSMIINQLLFQNNYNVIFEILRLISLPLFVNFLHLSSSFYIVFSTFSVLSFGWLLKFQL